MAQTVWLIYGVGGAIPILAFLLGSGMGRFTFLGAYFIPGAVLAFPLGLLPAPTGIVVRVLVTFLLLALFTALILLALLFGAIASGGLYYCCA